MKSNETNISIKKPFRANKLWPFFFAAPFLIAYLIFSLYPTLYSFYLSLYNWNGFSPKVFIGLKNYIDLLTIDPLFYKSLSTTIIIMFLSIPFQIIIGLLLANYVYSLRKLQHFVSTVLFIPYIIAPVVVGVIFAYLFDWHNGYVNDIFMRIGLLKTGIYWLQTTYLVKYLIAIMGIWRLSGYCMVIYLAGITSIPVEIYEAAKIDGAKAIQTFFYITIPQLKNITMFLVLTSIINGLQLFEMPVMLYSSAGGMAPAIVGGPDNAALTIIWKFYDNTFKTGFRLGYGAAMSYVLFVVIVIFTILSFKISTAKKENN